MLIFKNGLVHMVMDEIALFIFDKLNCKISCIKKFQPPPPPTKTRSGVELQVDHSNMVETASL